MAPPQHDPRRPYKRAAISDQPRLRPPHPVRPARRRPGAHPQPRQPHPVSPIPLFRRRATTTLPRVPRRRSLRRHRRHGRSQAPGSRPAALVRPPDHAPGVDGRRPSPSRPRLQLYTISEWRPRLVTLRRHTIAMDSVLSLCMSPRLTVFRQHIREARLISRMVCCFTTSKHTIKVDSHPLHWYRKMRLAASMFLIRIARDTFQPSSMLCWSCKRMES